MSFRVSLWLRFRFFWEVNFEAPISSCFRFDFVLALGWSFGGGEGDSEGDLVTGADSCSGTPWLWSRAFRAATALNIFLVQEWALPNLREHLGRLYERKFKFVMYGLVDRPSENVRQAYTYYVVFRANKFRIRI